MTDTMERILYFKPLNKPDFKAEYNFTYIMLIEFLKTYDNSLSYIYLVDFETVTFDFIKLMDLPFIQKLVHIVIVSMLFCKYKINVNKKMTFWSVDFNL